MNRAGVLLLLAAGCLAGCKAVDGSYYPDCVAFAGDVIELRGGRFSWDKFTDERRIDEQGQPVDPFPEYPKHGAYDVAGETIRLSFDGEGSTETFHIGERQGRVVLLTPAAYSEWQASGEFPQCVLTREELD